MQLMFIRLKFKLYLMCFAIQQFNIILKWMSWKMVFNLFLQKFDIIYSGYKIRGLVGYKGEGIP